MTNKNIPNDDDFARASSALKKRSSGLSEVREKILTRFQRSGEIFEFFIIDNSETSFTAYIFYRWERQIKEAGESGLAEQIGNTVIDELGKVGKGSQNGISINFEFDSHENVEQNYDGDYYSRLR